MDINNDLIDIEKSINLWEMKWYNDALPLHYYPNDLLSIQDEIGDYKLLIKFGILGEEFF